MYEWILGSIEQSKIVFQKNSLDWGFKLSEPATNEKIRQCEQALGLPLPYSYCEFLLRYNGAHLFCTSTAAYSETERWWSNSGIVVLGLEALLFYRQHLQWIYELSDSLEVPFPIPIAYLGRICTGDFCALNINELTKFENPVMYCEQDRDPIDWKNDTIAHSFECWLQKMLNQIIERKRLPEYWLQDTLYDGSLTQVLEM